MKPMLFPSVAILVTVACSRGTPMPPGPDPSKTASAAECHFSLADSTRIYAEAEVDQPPRILRPGPQDYPADLRAHHIEGWVLLHYVIDATGSPISVSITVDSATHPAFVPAATGMIAGTRFRPGALMGRTVPVCVRQRINWSMS